MNLKILILSERSQTNKSTNYVVPFIEISKKCQLIHSDRKQHEWSLGAEGESGRDEREGL